MNIYMTSDLHLGHAGMITQGWRAFDSVEEMDTTIIDRWNAVVRPQDKVYVLGDVVMRKRSLEKVAALQGHKVLIAGNHDIYPIKDYLPYFKRVYGARPFDNVILTHFPVHPAQLGRRFAGNVHGHLHGGKIIDDPRYWNANTELSHYTPMPWETIKKLWRLTP